MALLVSTLVVINSQKLGGKDIRFNFIHRGEIHSSWKNMTQDATLQFGKNIRVVSNSEKFLLQNVLKKGDRVSISIGYDGNLNQEFSGFVTRFDARIPLSIYCEDNMWLLKKDELKKSWQKANLKDVAKFIIDHYNKKYNYNLKVEADDAELGQFAIDKLTGAQTLDFIRSTYGLISYFRGDTLYCQLANGIRSGRQATMRYDFRRNIISNSLEYVEADDLKIRVKAISFQSNNKKIAAEAGDPEGELHTYHAPKGLNQVDLNKYAQQELDRVKYTGYRGSFLSFGIPYPKHGDIADIRDQEFPDREGRFIIYSVTTQFGVVGIRRTIEIGRKA
jgi:hypothetical protein